VHLRLFNSGIIESPGVNGRFVGSMRYIGVRTHFCLSFARVIFAAAASLLLSFNIVPLCQKMNEKEEGIAKIPKKCKFLPQAILWLSREFGLGEISLISSNHEASKIFVAEATAMGLRVPRILELSPDHVSDVPRQVESFLRHQGRNSTHLGTESDPENDILNCFACLSWYSQINVCVVHFKTGLKFATA
jgi:hypothetical protein